MGGPAELFASPETEKEIIELQSWAQKNNLPITILGGGSNVLISDNGIKGLVICLRRFSKVNYQAEYGDRLKIEVEAGTPKMELLKIFLKFKISPALFLAGIPGDIGGGIVMNAGVAENYHPKEFCEIVDWIRVLKPNGEIKIYFKNEIHWTYRHSDGWQPGIILQAGLSWPLEDTKSLKNSSILDQVKLANKNRLAKQPLDLPSCGSVFVNPPNLKAAQLIDSAGLKGYSIGGAEVSTKHANFIVNKGQAKASDILKLIEHVQREVLARHKVQLNTEVIKLGF